MKAIILAAGQGIRLGDNFIEVPKILLNIGDKTILERQLESFTNIGISDVSVVVGTKGSCWNQGSYDMINTLCKEVILNFDNDITCNAFSTYLAFRNSNADDVLIVDGDVVYCEGLLDKILSSKYGNIMVAKTADSRKELGCRLVANNDNKLINIGKNIIDIKFPWHIYSGIMKIEKRSYNSFYKKLKNSKFISEELVDTPIREFINHDNMYILKTSDKDWVNINTQNEFKKAINLFLN